jgi:hypothetical protein
MMTLQGAKARTPIRCLFQKGSDQIFWASFFLLTLASSSLAEVIYRCGNAYSNTQHCAQETATEFNAQTAPRHPGSAHNTKTTLEQREADGLEKKRLQAERHAAQNLPSRAIVQPLQGQDTSTTAPPRQAQRPRRPTSPYFTAKDPNKPAHHSGKD